MILYLHGFRSSPASAKSSLLAAALRARGLSEQWCCPQLPASPRAAMALALGHAQDWLAAGGKPDGLVVMGSSLGGFYATWLAERLGIRAVVLNPVVHASRDLATQVGSHRGFHDDQPFEFLPEYVAELTQAEADIPPELDPARYFLVAATGDEVLDWRDMRERYRGCRQRIIQGSDHGLSDFADYLPEVLAFALGSDRADELTLEPVEGATASALSRRPSTGCPGWQVCVDHWQALEPLAAPIRHEVFVEEQQVPAALEMDEMDAVCLHALALSDTGEGIGTGRLLPDGHIGRMAVCKPWRGQGVGSALLKALMAAARDRGDAEVVLAAQVHAQAFYVHHGFVAEGQVFTEAGIPHVLMRCRLDPTDPF